jgi:uncharacterized protein
MSGTQGSFVWAEYLGTDVAAAKAFYGKVVGWEMQDVPMPGMTYTLLSSGGVQAGGLMAMPKEARDAGMRPCWSTYIEVDDVEAAAANVQRLGGQVRKPPTDIPTVGRFAVVADPQGAMFNLFKPLQHMPRSVSVEPGQLGWYELHTREAPKAFDFYSAMFGWEKGDAMDMGPMGKYQLFNIGTVLSGGMFNSPAAERSPFWLLYFNVGNIDEASARVTDGGGKITNGPVQVPGGGWIVQAMDPQGASFALLGKR